MLILSDFILSGVIVLATKAGLNPDNLATPLAAALGDVVSISLLSLMTSFLYNNICEIFQAVSDVQLILKAFFRYSSVDCLRHY